MTARILFQLLSQGSERVRVDDMLTAFDSLSKRSVAKTENREKAYLHALTSCGDWIDYVDVAHMVQRFSIENAHTDPVELTKMFSRLGVTRLSQRQAAEIMQGLGISVTEKDLDQLMTAVFGPDCDGDLTVERLQKIFSIIPV